MWLIDQVLLQLWVKLLTLDVSLQHLSHVHKAVSVTTYAGAANSGNGAFYGAGDGDGNNFLGGNAGDGAIIVAGAAVTPAASITVTVGAGGVAGTNGSAGGTGYVYIEYQGG